jgi:hypothetical protein
MKYGRKKSHVQLKTRSVATQPGPSPSGLANVKNSIIGSPPSGVLTSSVNQDQDPSSASDDKVRESRK